MEMISKLQIPLYRGHTHGEFAIAPTSPVGKQVGDWIRDKLSEKEYIPQGYVWDPIRKVRFFNGHAYWKIKRLFCYYDKKTNMLHVPIRFCDLIKKEIEIWGGEVQEKKISDYKIEKMSIKMNPKFTDRPEQVEPIKQCSEMGVGVKGLNLQTGKGKTYSSIKSAVNIGYKTIIIVPGLVEQWIDDIAEYTTARKGFEIYKIEGFQTFAFLAQHPEYKPDFFVASTRTMQMFANCDDGYEVLPWDYTGFFKAYGIGMKIIDECHKQFHANTMMDMLSNVPYNLYLSATFDQTSKHARAIFNRIFPPEIMVGGCAYDKYVTVYFVNFFGEVNEKRCVKSKGYMHTMYETELLKSNSRLDAHVNNVLAPLINQHYINRYEKGHRCLIFCSTIEFVNALVDRLEKMYPQLKINSYTAGTSRSVLAESDLVVSTIGKASTGLDWKGLRCCLNTVSVRSPVLTSQMLGRLRKINGEQLIYVDLCDQNSGAQRRHAEDRKRDLKRMAAKFYEWYGVSNLDAPFNATGPSAEATISTLWS